MINRRSLVGNVLAGSAFCLCSGRARSAVPVRVAVSSTSFVVGGLRIGEQADLFSTRDLDLSVVVMESGNAAMSALISGSVPFAVTGPPETLAARARRQDVVIVANLYAGFAGSVVLASSVARRLAVSPAAPVTERFRALDDLVLAVPSPTSVLVAPIRTAAESVGAKVRFTYMAQGAMPAAVETGAVGGMVASYPFAGTPILRGTGVLWIDGPKGELPPDVAPASSAAVQTMRLYAEKNPGTVEALRRAVKATADFILSDPPAAKRALKAAYPDLAPQDVDLAFDQQWRNWTKPVLSAADMRQELKLLAASTKAPGLDGLDPAAALLGP